MTSVRLLAVLACAAVLAPSLAGAQTGNSDDWRELNALVRLSTRVVTEPPIYPDVVRRFERVRRTTTVTQGGPNIKEREQLLTEALVAYSKILTVERYEELVRLARADAEFKSWLESTPLDFNGAFVVRGKTGLASLGSLKKLSDDWQARPRNAAPPRENEGTALEWNPPAGAGPGDFPGNLRALSAGSRQTVLAIRSGDTNAARANLQKLFDFGATLPDEREWPANLRAEYDGVRRELFGLAQKAGYTRTVAMQRPGGAPRPAPPAQPAPRNAPAPAEIPSASGAPAPTMSDQARRVADEAIRRVRGAAERLRGMAGRATFARQEASALETLAARTKDALLEWAGAEPEKLDKALALVAGYDAAAAKTDAAERVSALRAWQAEASAALAGSAAVVRRDGLRGNAAIASALADERKRAILIDELIRRQPDAAYLRDWDPAAFQARLVEFVKANSATLEALVNSDPESAGYARDVARAREESGRLEREAPAVGKLTQAQAEYARVVADNLRRGLVHDGAKFDAAVVGLAAEAAPGSLAEKVTADGRSGFRFTDRQGRTVELFARDNGLRERVIYGPNDEVAARRLETAEGGVLQEESVLAGTRGALRMETRDVRAQAADREGNAVQTRVRVELFYSGEIPAGWSFAKVGRDGRPEQGHEEYKLSILEDGIGVDYGYVDPHNIARTSRFVIPGGKATALEVRGDAVAILQADGGSTVVRQGGVWIRQLGNKTITQQGTTERLPDGRTTSPEGTYESRQDGALVKITENARHPGAVVSVRDEALAPLISGDARERAFFSRRLAGQLAAELKWTNAQRDMAAAWLRHAASGNPRSFSIYVADGKIHANVDGLDLEGEFGPSITGSGQGLVFLSDDLGLPADDRRRRDSFWSAREASARGMTNRFGGTFMNLPENAPRLEVLADGTVVPFRYDLRQENTYRGTLRAEVLEIWAGDRKLAEYDAMSQLGTWGIFSKAVNDATVLGAINRGGKPLMDLGKIAVNANDMGENQKEIALIVLASEKLGLSEEERMALARLRSESDWANIRETLCSYYVALLNDEGQRLHAKEESKKKGDQVREILRNIGNPEARARIAQQLVDQGVEEMKAGMAWNAASDDKGEQNRLVRRLFAPRAEDDADLQIRGFDRYNIDNRYKMILDEAAEARGLKSAGLYVLGYAHKTTVTAVEMLPAMLVGKISPTIGAMGGPADIMMAWTAVDGVGNLSEARGQELRYAGAEAFANLLPVGVHFGLKAKNYREEQRLAAEERRFFDEYAQRVSARLRAARGRAPAEPSIPEALRTPPDVPFNAAAASGKAFIIKNFLKTLLREHPEAAAGLQHLDGVIDGANVRFETPGELPADTAAMYYPSTNEVVFNHRLIDVPTHRLAETLAHELQHAYDERAAGRTLEASRQNEFRAHEAQNRATELIAERFRRFNAERGTDFSRERTLDGREIAGGNATAEGYLRTMDAARAARLAGPEALREFVNKLYHADGVLDLDTYPSELAAEIRKLESLAKKRAAGEKLSERDQRALDGFLDEHRKRAAERGSPALDERGALAECVADRLAIIDAAKIDGRVELPYAQRGPPEAQGGRRSGAGGEKASRLDNLGRSLDGIVDEAFGGQNPRSLDPSGESLNRVVERFIAANRVGPIEAAALRSRWNVAQPIDTAARSGPAQASTEAAFQKIGGRRGFGNEPVPMGPVVGDAVPQPQRRAVLEAVRGAEGRARQARERLARKSNRTDIDNELVEHLDAGNVASGSYFRGMSVAELRKWGVDPNAKMGDWQQAQVPGDYAMVGERRGTIDPQYTSGADVRLVQIEGETTPYRSGAAEAERLMFNARRLRVLPKAGEPGGPPRADPNAKASRIAGVEEAPPKDAAEQIRERLAGRVSLNDADLAEIRALTRMMDGSNLRHRPYLDRIFYDSVNPESLPSNGIKLRVADVAATGEAAIAGRQRILAAFLRVMEDPAIGDKVQFKIALAMKAMTGTQAGKFITIYTADPAVARTFAERLDTALAAERLPAGALPPEDFAYGRSGLVAWRYGAFKEYPGTVRDAQGREVGFYDDRANARGNLEQARHMPGMEAWVAEAGRGRPAPAAAARPAAPAPAPAAPPPGHRLVRGQAEPFDYAALGPMRLTLGAKVLELRAPQDLPPGLRARLGADVRYLLFDPADPAQYKGLREGDTLALGRDNPGRFKLTPEDGISGVSRQHLQIKVEGGRLIFTDLSSFGTSVQSARPQQGAKASRIDGAPEQRIVDQPTKADLGYRQKYGHYKLQSALLYAETVLANEARAEGLTHLAPALRETRGRTFDRNASPDANSPAPFRNFSDVRFEDHPGEIAGLYGSDAYGVFVPEQRVGPDGRPTGKLILNQALMAVPIPELSTLVHEMQHKTEYAARGRIRATIQEESRAFKAEQIFFDASMDWLGRRPHGGAELHGPGSGPAVELAQNVGILQQYRQAKLERRTAADTPARLDALVRRQYPNNADAAKELLDLRVELARVSDLLDNPDRIPQSKARAARAAALAAGQTSAQAEQAAQKAEGLYRWLISGDDFTRELTAQRTQLEADVRRAEADARLTPRQPQTVSGPERGARGPSEPAASRARSDVAERADRVLRAGELLSPVDADALIRRMDERHQDRPGDRWTHLDSRAQVRDRARANRSATVETAFHDRATARRAIERAYELLRQRIQGGGEYLADAERLIEARAANRPARIEFDFPFDDPGFGYRGRAVRGTPAGADAVDIGKMSSVRVSFDVFGGRIEPVTIFPQPDAGTRWAYTGR